MATYHSNLQRFQRLMLVCGSLLPAAAFASCPLMSDGSLKIVGGKIVQPMVEEQPYLWPKITKEPSGYSRFSKLEIPEFRSTGWHLESKYPDFNEPMRANANIGQAAVLSTVLFRPAKPATARAVASQAKFYCMYETGPADAAEKLTPGFTLQIDVPVGDNRLRRDLASKWLESYIAGPVTVCETNPRDQQGNLLPTNSCLFEF